jgi:hypothetical protein
VYFSAISQSLVATLRSPGQPEMAKKRLKTRLTLPSKIGAEISCEIEIIAPAVERPIPGSSESSSTFVGNSP